MSSEKTSFFTKTGSTDEPKKSTSRVLLLSAGRLLRSARNILHSSKILFRTNEFPSETSEMEKAAFKESLISLANRVKQIEEVSISLGAKSPERQEKIQLEKKNIQGEFQKMKDTLEKKTEAELTPLFQEQKKLEDELTCIKTEYLQKKKELTTKKHEISQKKKEISARKKLRLKAATNAKRKAIQEIQSHYVKGVDPSVLDLAEKSISKIKTDINRVKGNLVAIFPSKKDEFKLHAILKGSLHSPEPSPSPSHVTAVQQDEKNTIQPKQEHTDSHLPLEKGKDIPLESIQELNEEETAYPHHEEKYTEENITPTS